MNYFFLQSGCMDAFYNLAMEELLLDHLPKDGFVFFLWQSRNAVVIGRNQNPWKETGRGFMRAKGIELARRISGGGAVYQDGGNLNFSFIAEKGLMDVKRQLKAVCDSLAAFGIPAGLNYRKDLTALGRKFSGNAYAFRRGRALHHGTLLISADLGMMKALEGEISIAGLLGTLSEKSEVINLNEINPAITVKDAAISLRNEIGKLVGSRLIEAGIHEICDAAQLTAYVQKHRSWEWRYGNTPAFEMELGEEENRVSIRMVRGRVAPRKGSTRADTHISNITQT